MQAFSLAAFFFFAADCPRRLPLTPVRLLPYVMSPLVAGAGCSTNQARPEDTNQWLVFDPDGKGTITCQSTLDEAALNEILTCETHGMQIRNLGRTLSTWTIHVNRNSGEPCCREVLPCCLKGTSCPCELFDLMRAKNVLPKRASGTSSPGGDKTASGSSSCVSGSPVVALTFR